MADYELVVIIDPALSDEQIQEEVETLKSLVSEYGGELKKVDSWGKRKLAYQINKKREGFYVLLRFAIEESSRLIDEINRRLKMAEKIIRHMVVKTPRAELLKKKEKTQVSKDAEEKTEEVSSEETSAEEKDKTEQANEKDEKESIEEGTQPDKALQERKEQSESAGDSSRESTE